VSIKNVIFDLGKVLVDYDFGIIYRKLGSQLIANDLHDSTELISVFDAGKISSHKFYSIVKDKYGLTFTFEEFTGIWCNIFSEIPDMIKLAEKINEKYEVFILSNTDELHFPFVWKKFPSLHFFGKNLMLSYELGRIKPDPESFKRALQKFNLKPEESLFIDDKIENIEAAVKMGMSGIWHFSYAITYNKIAQILEI